MEEQLERLVNAVECLNSGFPWSDLISAFLSFAAILVTIFLWQKERYDRNCPHLQIFFEPVRSTLACIVLKNVSEVPLVVKQLSFNEEFTKQLPEKVQCKLAKMSEINVSIFPSQKWVISFDVNVFDILNNYSTQTVEIKSEYCRIKKKKRYSEDTKIDYSEYGSMLVYISDVDELKNSVKKLANNVEGLTEALKDGAVYGQKCD